MSWTDVFPMLGDAQVAAYRAAATAGEEALLDEWCGVARTVNPRTGPHLVAVSLFWKHPAREDDELPPVTRERMRDAESLGLVRRHAPWQHYVEPLLDGARLLRAERPDVVLRVYLAADLDFLVDDLVEADCEVVRMKGSSLRHNPGAMWRFLAFGEEGRSVTIIDADRARDVLLAVRRTELATGSGLGLWRVPYVRGSVAHGNDPGEYRPISACQFGGRGGYPVDLWMRAFLWHTMRGTMPNDCTVPADTAGPAGAGVRKLPIFATDWPTYGFDEWFLIAVLYPRMAFAGVLTMYSLNDPAADHWFALDIEYVTWANPRSEIVYFEHDEWLARRDRHREPRPKPPPARSAVLERIVRESRPAAPEGTALDTGRNEDPVTLVVARYRENLDWLLHLPDDVEVVVYNKGPEIPPGRLRDRIGRWVALPNQGREADSYLHHLAGTGPRPSAGWTVFCQGDPFPHSPRFLELLRHRGEWSEVQGLTGRYLDTVPPPACLDLDPGERIAGISVRTEVCSAATLDVLRWRDDLGRHFFADYAEHHGVPGGWNLSGHFLECCGLTELAEHAWRAERLRFCYGAIFAVRNDRLARIPAECLPRMIELARGHYSHGYLYERLWLHLFGLPFVGPGTPPTIEAAAEPSTEKRLG